MKNEILKNNKGVTLVELLVVIVIIGIITGFGIPEYGRYIAKSRVRGAATQFLQHMRMSRTLAIKENRTYILTFNTGINAYLIGVDLDPANGNGSLTDAGDVYGAPDTSNANDLGGPVRQINVANEHGDNVMIGVANLVITPPNGPNGVAIVAQTTISFMPDSSTNPNGMIYFQETGRGYTFAIELANTAGKTNLFLWQGDENNTGVTTWTELR